MTVNPNPIKHSHKVTPPERPSVIESKNTQDSKISSVREILHSPAKLQAHLHEKSIKQMLGTIDYTYQKPEPIIPEDVAKNSTPAEMESLKKKAMIHYEEAMQALENSYTDLAVEDETVQKLIREASKRLLMIVDEWAHIRCKEKFGKDYTMDQVKLEANGLLAKVYLEGRRKEWNYAGQIGANPLALRKVLSEGNFRESMMLIRYMADDFLGIILADKKLASQINERLRESGANWQLHTELLLKPEEITYADEGNVYHCGIYARTNRDQTLSIKLSPKEAENWKRTHNPTIGKHKKSARIPLSEREQRYWTKEPITRDSDLGMQISWDAGAAWIRAATVKDNPTSRYLQVANDLKVPLLAGASGTTDKILSQLAFLGFNTKEELYAGRLAAMGWLIDSHSHSAHEILFASKSFGLIYEPGPQGYETVYPDDPSFIEKLRAKQKQQGFELPDFYLSGEYIRQLKQAV